MKALTAVFALAFLAVAPAGMAAPKKKHPHPAGQEYKITEASALAVTVVVGKAGEEHETFKITDQTKITLNGVKAAARDLKAGMVCTVQFGPDDMTATSIAAKDAPAHPAKHRVG